MPTPSPSTPATAITPSTCSISRARPRSPPARATTTSRPAPPPAARSRSTPATGTNFIQLENALAGDVIKLFGGAGNDTFLVAGGALNPCRLGHGQRRRRHEHDAVRFHRQADHRRQQRPAHDPQRHHPDRRQLRQGRLQQHPGYPRLRRRDGERRRPVHHRRGPLPGPFRFRHPGHELHDPVGDLGPQRRRRFWRRDRLQPHPVLGQPGGPRPGASGHLYHRPAGQERHQHHGRLTLN